MEIVNKVFQTEQEFLTWEYQEYPRRHYDYYNEPEQTDFPYFLHKVVELDNPNRGWNIIYVGFPISVLQEYLGE